MTIDRRFLNWGIFFVALGGVPLLVRQGIVSSATASEAWRLWPLIIVGIGVGILLRRTPAAFAGGFVVAATFGLVFGGLLATGPTIGGIAGCGNPNAGVGTATSQASGTLGGSASANIQMNCGVLDISTQPGSAWTFQGKDPQGATAIVSQGPSTLNIAAPATSTAFWDSAGSHNRSWQVTLPADPSMDLSVGVNAGSATIILGGAHLAGLDAEVNAADARIDLSSAQVGELHVSVNAGSGRLTLPSSSSTSGSLAVNAGSLDLCLAPGSAIRIHVTGALSSTDFSSQGLLHQGDSWVSPAFGSAANNVDLQLDANLASVNLNPAGGCQ